jgi:nitroreductase
VGERPVAYAVLMTATDPDVNLAIDIGLCAEAMILTAREKGIGACLFRSFNKDKLSEILSKDGYIPVLVISLGYPAEEVVIDEVKNGDIKYYRDENDVHHVPKLSLSELLI